MNSIRFLRFLYLVAGIICLLTVPRDLWYYPVLGYFVISVCNGVAGHRYFAHNQFSVNRVGHYLLGIMTTLGMFSPINYWIVQHKHHHRHSDDLSDIHSPKRGFWNAFILWSFSKQSVESAFNDRSSLFLLAKSNKDPVVRLLSKYFVLTNVVFLSLLILIDYQIACYVYLIGVLLDHVRLGLINVVCHTRSFGSYRIYETEDNSYNNLFLGWAGLGFGWHNTHHNDAGRLVLTERWFEIDIEGRIGQLFSIIFKPSNS